MILSKLDVWLGINRENNILILWVYIFYIDLPKCSSSANPISLVVWDYFRTDFSMFLAYFFFSKSNTNILIAPIKSATFSVYREAALTTILIKAGLGLDAPALLKLSFTVLKLAFVPCLAEAAAAAVIAHFAFDYPYFWGFMLGWAKLRVLILFYKRALAVWRHCMHIVQFPVRGQQGPG